MGAVGRFASDDGTRYPRGARVIARTERGLEIGEVLAPPEYDAGEAASDGTILRGMTVEDELLAARLEKNRDGAYAACVARMAQAGLATTLMDVEYLFDGQTLIFYFLGPQPPELEAITNELADTYEANVEFHRFAEAAMAGCGPGCGTEDAEGPGCGSCATGCAVAGACTTRRQ